MNTHYRYYLILNIILLLLSPLHGQTIYEREQPDLFFYTHRSTVISNPNRIKVGLVLSGGGARGLTHLGVLRGFEKYNFPIDLIVGTSMGSVVGGLHAAGQSVDQLEDSMRKIDWDAILSDATERQNLFIGQKAINDRYLVNIRFDGLQAFIPTSLTSGQKILTIITDELYKTESSVVYDFDNLEIPFRAISTDLISGKRVVIGKGDLAEAINASVAVPLLFSPVVWDDMLLVDGGLSANFAVDAAKSLGMDVVIVVDNTSPLKNRENLGAPWEIADQVTTILQQSANKEQIQQADLVIKPDISNISSSDFGKIDEMIIKGESAVDNLVSELYALLENDDLGEVQINYDYDSFNINFINSTELNPYQYPLYAENSHSISQAQIKYDIESLFSQGIYQHVFASIDTSDGKNVLKYNLTVNETVSEVRYINNDLFADSTLFQISKIKLDEPLNNNLLHKGLMEIKRQYRRNGYVLIQFTDVEFDPLTGILSIHIDEGRIEEIRIEGNEISTDFVILREFPQKINNAYNSKLVKTGIDNIYNTQLFEKVSVNVDREDNKYILIIKVVENKNTVLRLGGKAGSERGAQLYAEWANENFLGKAYKLSFNGRYGEMDRNIGFNYRVDRVFESLFTVRFRAYYDWKRFPYIVNDIKSGEFKEERKGVKFGIGLQLKKLGQISVELRLENVKDSPYSGNLTEEEKKRVTQNSELRTLSVKSVTDKRDNIAFATSGIYNIWFWETANQQIAQGQEKYTKAYVNLEAFYTYWTRHTFHFRGLIGIGDNTLPFSEWFRVGGLNDFIGLHNYEYFGRQVILANLEYRFLLPFQILSDIYVALRYDIGGVWETPDLVLKSEDFFTGFGGWIGLNTLLGPLYIGYGDTSNKKGVFYISLGYDF